MSHPHYCPNPKCKADQRAQKIPEEKIHTSACIGENGSIFGDKIGETSCTDPDNHCYGPGSTYFWHTTGFYAHDMTLFYFCPFCNAAWHRFTDNSHHQRMANVHMKREGFKDFTDILTTIRGD